MSLLGSDAYTATARGLAIEMFVRRPSTSGTGDLKVSRTEYLLSTSTDRNGTSAAQPAVRGSFAAKSSQTLTAFASNGAPSLKRTPRRRVDLIFLFPG